MCGSRACSQASASSCTPLPPLLDLILLPLVLFRSLSLHSDRLRGTVGGVMRGSVKGVLSGIRFLKGGGAKLMDASYFRRV